MPTEVGFIVDDPHSDHFIGALRKGIARIRLPHNSGAAIADYIALPEQELTQNRFNDGAIDPFGNIWAGSMDDSEQHVSGSWWHVDCEGHAKRLLTGFHVTNGPAFSPAKDHVYFNDSALKTTYRAAYDETGLVGEPIVWKEYDEQDGYPDGMTFSPDGLLWIAFWDGHCARAYDEDGVLRHQLALPVQRPTKLAFDDLGRGYVTSASIGLPPGLLDGRILVFEKI